MTDKTCRRCGQAKDISEFKRSTCLPYNDGRDIYCKDCRKEFAIECYHRRFAV